MPGIHSRDGEAGNSISLQDLLEELIMALLGYTGDVFVDISSAGLEDEIQHPLHCTVQIAPDITWIGREDREQLNELIHMGFHYKQLQQFIVQEEQPSSQGSLYRQAMCSGLTEILAVYEDEVVRLQLLMRQQGTARGVPGIMYELADLQMLLPQLHQIVYDLRRRAPKSDSVSRRQSEDTAACAVDYDSASGSTAISSENLIIPPEARGAKLLATLHAHRLNGQPLLQACLQRLLWHVNQVVFNQLTMWMVHGMLADEGGEFFIRPREPSETPGSTAPQQQQQDDTSRLPDKGPQGAALPTGVRRLMQQRTEDDTYKDWHEAFEVAMLELPPYITPNLAASVEFVGRAVRLLRAPPATAKLQDDTYSSGVQQWFLRPGQHQQLLPHEDTLAFASALRALQQQPMVSQAALERTIEAIRASVAGRLWELLVVQAGLMQHLNAVKDYLLLARGDFFQGFLADASRLLASPPREAAAANELAVPWQSAASKSTACDDPYFKLFKLVLKPKSKQHQQQQQGRASDSAATAESGASGGSVAGPKSLTVPTYDTNWDELALEVQLPWPLGVLLTPRHMEKYNKVFQLLLRLKRVQLALEQAWQELGRLCGRSGGNTRTADIMPLLQLRQHMGHLIGNLQIYLQLDVVDSNFALLQAKVAQAQDFAEAEHAHEQFLHALVTQSFLGHQSLVVLFGEVFSHTTALCRLVRGAKERGIDWDQVKEVDLAFDKTVSQLYVALRSRTLQQFDKAPYLRQLYQRLDFNGYLDSQKMRMFKVSQAVRAQQQQQSM